MSYSVLAKRLRFYRKYLLWILLVSLLPPTVLLVLSYHQTITNAEALLEEMVEEATRQVDLLLGEADTILNQIATDIHDVDSPEALSILRRTVYNNLLFREAGIIDEQGFLILTSLGRVDPPIRVSANSRADPAVQALQVIGPIKTVVMQERSIILSLPIRGQGEVTLLVDPTLLDYFVNVMDEADLGPDGFIAYVNQDSNLLAIDGLPPRDTSLILEKQRDGWLRVSQPSRSDAVTVIGEISRRWVLRNWWTELKIGGPSAAFCCGLLMILFIHLVHRMKAIDYDLKLGLINDELEVHYQPIIDMQTGRCVASEALIRWRHPELGVLLPEVFIPVAEQTGLIEPIGEWLIKRVVQEQAELFKCFPQLYVTINLSPVQLNSGRLDGVIQWLAEAAPALPQRFVFEVTEAAVVRDSTTIAPDILARLRSVGSRVAVDDFGKGYSSLSYLHRFDFDYLKVDRCFIRGIDEDNRIAAVLETLIELGRKLGLTVVAEGVENGRQRQHLQERGIRYAQGWLFSRPLPIRDFKDFLFRQERIV